MLRPALIVLTLAVVLDVWGRHARGQSAGAMLADDLIILSKGQRGKEKERTQTPLGLTPGSGQNPYHFAPGQDEPILRAPTAPGEPSFPAPRPERGVLSAAGEPEKMVPARPLREPPPVTATPGEAPIYGPLELPDAEDAGPPHGLTLDMAIDRLVHENHDLRSKFFEVDQAEADVLSAGLRANPILFASADGVPYGNYSPRRPGTNDYTFVYVQPIDINGKRRARVAVRQQTKTVLQAQYQNAVRLMIEQLAGAFADVLAAREEVRYARASVAGLDVVLRATEKRYRKGSGPRTEVDRIALQRDGARVGVGEAVSRYRQAKQVLAAMLNLPDAEADALEVRGRLRDEPFPPPPVDHLIPLALENRPDLAAFRLGVRLAEANVSLARAEQFEDVFVLYTPATYTNNMVGERNTTSWSLGGVVSVPLFNRNQGNIARARSNVHQTQTQMAGLQRQVIAEVRRAAIEWESSHASVAQIERDMLPRARRMLDDSFRIYTQAEGTILDYQNALRDYNDVVRQYRNALIRHRRSMLRLNTAVGLRVLP
jgi:outer membrane protein, heavy metal efflux system